MRLECGLVYDPRGGTGEGLVKSVSIGDSLEAGNAWPSRSAASYSDLKTAGSVLFTTDTFLGPLFLEYGRSENFESWYHYLNHSF